MNKKSCIYFFIFCFVLLNILLIIRCLNIKENQDNYFRLHIVANSNSIEDQITKLNVSKEVTNYINKICGLKCNNSALAKEKITNNINTILEIANNELKENNANYEAYANIGKISYDEKHSETLDMEEGTYNSLQIILGKGNGENFWTLIFPYAYNYESQSNINISDTNTADIEIKSGFAEMLKRWLS